tara:strand:+ start:62 stop:394 length:333 start_codon:yes stop_codon:yes gene_type:complete
MDGTKSKDSVLEDVSTGGIHISTYVDTSDMDAQQKSLPENQKINPSHYKQGDIEVIDFIIDQKMDYLTSNICKYICRWRFKDGLCDLKKARWYLDKLIKQEEGRGGSDSE